MGVSFFISPQDNGYFSLSVLSYRDVENIECIFFVKKYQFCFCLFGVLALTKIIVCQKNGNFAKTCCFLFDYLCRIVIQSK